MFERVFTSAANYDIVQVFDEQVFEWKVKDMSALQIQPQLLEQQISSARSHIYVVPDITPSNLPSNDLDNQISARSVAAHSPKANASDLADTAHGWIEKSLAYFSAAVLLAGIGAGAGLFFQPDVDGKNTQVAAVQAGDSLWSIADRLDIEGRSIEDVVSDIRILNGLESNVLIPGQILNVPTK